MMGMVIGFAQGKATELGTSAAAVPSAGGPKGTAPLNGVAQSASDAAAALAGTEAIAAFAKEVEAILRDPTLTDDQKTEKIIDAAETRASESGMDPHTLVQETRRHAWTSADERLYNSQPLVNAHYYFKGKVLPSATMSIYDEYIKRYGGVTGAKLAQNLLEGKLKYFNPWTDPRPPSPYSPSTKEWFDKGAKESNVN